MISPAGMNGVTIGQMTPWMGVWGIGFISISAPGAQPIPSLERFAPVQVDSTTITILSENRRIT